MKPNPATILIVLFFPSLALAQGFTPIVADTAYVAFGLTDEKSPFSQDASSVSSASLGGTSLPIAGPAHYQVAVLDTASNGVFLNSLALEGFGIADAGAAGANQLSLGDSIGTISDALGVYVAGLQFSTSGETIQIETTELRGSINNSIVYTADDQHENLIGSPILQHYATVIKNSASTRIGIGDSIFYSPGVELRDPTALPPIQHKVPLKTVANTPVAPSFVPNPTSVRFDDDPLSPTLGTNFFVGTNIHHENSTQGVDLVVSSGLSTTVISTSAAQRIGINLNSEPDFRIRLEGFTLEEQGLSGYVVDSLTFSTLDGDVEFPDVPLVIVDDSVVVRDGFLGTNLLWDRDWVLDPTPNNAFLGFSEVIAPRPNIDTICRHIADGALHAEQLSRALRGNDLPNGDVDLNGTVEFTDFLIVSSNFDSGHRNYTEGDLNCDGRVVFADFLILSANFGATTQLATVPEPVGPCWMLIAGVAALVTRRRRNGFKTRTYTQPSSLSRF